jgi:hypothetical protein
MKNLIFVSLFVFFGIGMANSQTFTCPGNNFVENQIVEFGTVTCENDGNIDYLMVRMTVTDVSDCSSSLVLSNLPEDVSVDGGSINPNTSHTFFDGSYNLAIPSDNCADVASVMNITSFTDCGDCLIEFTLSESLVIPTLGQWGLILLSLACMVFGVLYLRKRIVQEAMN